MELTTLRQFIEQKYREFEEHSAEAYARNGRRYCTSFEEESLFWTIQDWYGMKGEFTKEEYEYLYEVWSLSKDLVDAIVEGDINDAESYLSYKLD